MPTPDDILPLVTGVPDPRLDRLKQWIVHLHHRKAAAKQSAKSRYARLFDEVFEIIGQLVEGVVGSRGKVDPDTSEITVFTADGPLPIEAVSQGTTSLIGWAGIILQRLHELYGDEENPRHHYAVVLMDEIDAHLHPAWQQTLVSRLQALFPNIQFIASTHSPLIIGGMQPHEIVRLCRDEGGRVRRLEIDPDMMLGRTDQILTTSLFGLKTTLDTTTQGHIVEYLPLLGQTGRRPHEERRFQELRHILRTRIPPIHENLDERRAAVAERARLTRLVAELDSAEAQRPVRKSWQSRVIPARKSADHTETDLQVTRARRRRAISIDDDSPPPASPPAQKR